MSNTSDVALGGLLRILDSMLSSIENLRIQDQFRRELAGLLAQTDVEAANLDHLRQKYFNIAQRYLDLKQPFHWNIQDSKNPENGRRDIAQYLELVEFSAFIGAYDLLKVYGFDCLVVFGGSQVLAQDYTYYYDSFEYLLSQKSKDLTEPYFRYIFQQFESLCS